jgi:NADPH:quinone reductase-like Zn-dependent oxidoreductase
LTYGGAYAEYVAIQAGTLIQKPASLSWEEAAAIPEVNLSYGLRESQKLTQLYRPG